MNQILHTLKLPDFVTLLNALCGVIAIIIVLDGFTYLAPLLILIAAIADGADGHLARKFSSSEIGGNLDSLADVISFGVAPVIITYSYITGAQAQYILLPAMLFYFICGILRLARFNTMHLGMNAFSGLPITAGGIAVSSYLLIGERFFDTYTMALLAIVLGFLMISNVTYIKARNKNILVSLTLIFAATIVSYFVNIEYTHIMASILSGLMTFYIISPIIKKNKEVQYAGKRSNN
ncbi:archaetidylserine synthase [Methanolobus sediminis]|uniref:CDP-diacylglycerol--serine O-phosphatidyltransferase n=1 Tax=Methanolobus sediminis TaxID=3072978 RepID=A0AA51UIP1_9EURY|nr:archaetidylserine synthase [Methanolobus sediminis]WMW24278.1 archaetidylserine synthase [Methanolobus sediminis]